MRKILIDAKQLQRDAQIQAHPGWIRARAGIEQTIVALRRATTAEHYYELHRSLLVGYLDAQRSREDARRRQKLAREEDPSRVRGGRDGGGACPLGAAGGDRVRGRHAGRAAGRAALRRRRRRLAARRLPPRGGLRTQRRPTGAPAGRRGRPPDRAGRAPGAVERTRHPRCACRHHQLRARGRPCCAWSAGTR